MDTTHHVLEAGRYYGKTTRRLDLSGLLSTEAVYGNNHRTPVHVHEHAYFSVTLWGANDTIQNATSSNGDTAPLMFHPPDACTWASSAGVADDRSLSRLAHPDQNYWFQFLMDSRSGSGRRPLRDPFCEAVRFMLHSVAIIVCIMAMIVASSPIE